MRLVLLYYFLCLAILAASQDAANDIKSAKGKEINFQSSSIMNISTIEDFKIKENSLNKAVAVDYEVGDESKICFSNPCYDLASYSLFPDPYDRTKFYWCNADRVPIPKSCPPRMGFDIAMGACIKISDPDCPVCMEDGTYTTLDVGNDYEFCVCINGIATKIECPKDSPFNPDLGICYSNAPCDPSFCLNNKDYEVAENRNDTKSFCMCIDEKPIIVNCPNDSTFNPYIKKCSEYEISPKCLQSVCVDPKNNLKVFNPIDPKTSNGVCVCRQQMATFSPCNNGTILNPNLTICQLAEINCNSYQCRDLPDKTKIPALNTTDGYCECVKGIATYYNCPQNGEFNVITEKCEAPICDLTECKTPGQRIPASNTTDGFCDCTTGSYAPCPDGEKFGKFGLCKPPCIDLLCSGKPDQYLIPSSVNDHSFCMCHTTQVGTQTASYEKCNPTSYLFDETKQMCVANSGKLCGTDVCGADLGPKPAKDNSNGFCLCTKPGDKPVFKECLEGIYDDSIKACLKTTTEDVCDFTKCNFPNQRIAASNTTDGYCDCTMGYVSCPEGTKFGKYLMCMEPCTPELCTRKENNYVIESTVNDQSFCVCQTIATYEECEPKGFIFDKTQGTCVPNSEELCGTELCTYLGSKPAKDTSTGFCLCTKQGDKPKFIKCLEGIYDDNLKICETSKNA